MCGADAGVYVGASSQDYNKLLLAQQQGASRSAYTPYSGTGAALSVLAGRVAYTCNMHGPSIVCDTACSSALVAIHGASSALRLGQCPSALAGGVNLTLTPDTPAAFQAAGMLAMDGRCKTLSAEADGYVRAEACGLLQLETMVSVGAATAADDPVRQPLGVLAGSAVNQDGRSSALTAPNGPAQQAVIRSALQSGGTMHHSISSLQMHGTGTPLGDPIEVSAAAAVLIPKGSSRQPLAMLASKSWCGHAEPCAGVMGVMLAAQGQVQQATLPILHLRAMNPSVAAAVGDGGERMVAARQLAPKPLSSPLQPSRATDDDDGLWQPLDATGISAFAFQGTNAHAVMLASPPAMHSADHSLTQLQGTLPAATDKKADRQTVRKTQLVWARKHYWSPSAPHSTLLHRFLPAQPTSAAATFEVSLAHPKLAPLANLSLTGSKRLMVPSMALIAMASAAVRALSLSPASTSSASSNASTALTDGVLSAPHLLSHAAYAQLSLLCSVDAATGALRVSGFGPKKWSKPKSMLSCATMHVSEAASLASSNVAREQQQQPSAVALSILGHAARWAVQHSRMANGEDGAQDFVQVAYPGGAAAADGSGESSSLVPASDYEPDVAACCMAEAELALQVLQGQGMLAGFEVWRIQADDSL
uniref:Ketosynthase family 3 (KS3) domain-containing protein n=1 Tax=Dunaliella tertiolecta TaxID=3047 RepID=A0A7S3QW51_DUNTE